MTVAREALVHGRVQGVNYRAWVAERARARGVSGSAANRADGSVAVWLEGEPDAVAAVERALAEGPPHAAVDRVDARDAQPRGASGFSRR